MPPLMAESHDIWEWWWEVSHIVIASTERNSNKLKVFALMSEIWTVWVFPCLLISLLHPARILMEKFRYSFPSLQDVFCFATIQRHARSSLALFIWATSTLHWEASFLIASRWLLDSQKRELWSTTGTLKERRCDSAQFLLEQRTCWVSKGNLCNIF